MRQTFQIVKDRETSIIHAVNAKSLKSKEVENLLFDTFFTPSSLLVFVAQNHIFWHFRVTSFRKDLNIKIEDRGPKLQTKLALRTPNSYCDKLLKLTIGQVHMILKLIFTKGKVICNRQNLPCRAGGVSVVEHGW